MSDILGTKKIRYECTNTAVYQRGLNIADVDGVWSLIVKKISSVNCKLISEVEGSGGFSYDVSVDLVRVNQDYGIYMGACTCRAFHTYDGFCKHLAAMLIAFDRTVDYGQLDSFMNECKVNDEFDAFDIYDEFGNGTFHKVESSTSLLEAMSEITLMERNQFCQELTGGDVILQPTLYINENTEHLEFKIGRSQLYVLKNVQEFVENIREQKFVKYGKKLEFECPQIMTSH